MAKYCQAGWPEKRELPGKVRPYYPMASEISVTEQLLMRQNRIIIPEKLRSGIFKEIHSGHQGISMQVQSSGRTMCLVAGTCNGSGITCQQLC